MPIFVDLDSMRDVEDYASDTLRDVADRVAASNSPEQMVYREAELDEIWRLIDMDLAAASEAGSVDGQLVALRGLVQRAHDHVGQEEDTASASALLREAVQFAPLG